VTCTEVYPRIRLRTGRYPRNTLRENTASHQSTQRPTCLHCSPGFGIFLRHLVSWRWD